jgi:2-polyprenyl-6-hydroxyphenyl methylase/3-demethylubiquinone-9 3-methyltransferase
VEIAKGHLEGYLGKEKAYFSERLDYFIGSVDDFLSKYESKKFDTVSAMEVIEHVNEPMEFLATINRALKDDGLLFLSTINKNTLSYLSTILGNE